MSGHHHIILTWSLSFILSVIYLLYTKENNTVMSTNNNSLMTVKELAYLFKGWLIETVNKELGKNIEPLSGLNDNLDEVLQYEQNDNGLGKVRALRFREALAGLESLLVNKRDIEFAPVLDHIVQNIGASLQGLDLLMPASGLVNGPQLDYRSMLLFPAMVAPRRYIPLPILTKTMLKIGLGKYWPANSTVFLTEYREWQPRFLRLPAHDDECYGLFVWNNLPSKQVCFFPLHPLPDSPFAGPSELMILNSRPSWIARLLDSDPPQQEHIIQLSARHFTLLLHALLLDYEQHHMIRQREIAEQDQLGAMLWDFLSRE